MIVIDQVLTANYGHTVAELYAFMRAYLGQIVQTYAASPDYFVGGSDYISGA